MKNLVLRAVHSGDMPFLEKLYASTRQEEMSLAGLPKAQADAFLAMQFNAQHQHYQKHYQQAQWSIVECDGVPAGRLYINRATRDIRIIDIALLPEYKNRGIGRQLVEPLLAEARRKAVTVSLHVDKNNPVRQWYCRLGFIMAEDKGVYDFMRYSPNSARA